MKVALDEAKKAKEKGEVPIGAIIVKDNIIVGRGHNLTISNNDPTAHAEIVALKDAATNLGTYRLCGCDLFVTIEPCIMCAGALVWARIDKVYYGAKDIKAGGLGSAIDILSTGKLNHSYDVIGGILEDECRDIIQEFFRNLRLENKLKKEKAEEE